MSLYLIGFLLVTIFFFASPMLAWLYHRSPEVMSGLAVGFFLIPAGIASYHGNLALAGFITFLVISVWIIRNPEYTSNSTKFKNGNYQVHQGNYCNHCDKNTHHIAYTNLCNTKDGYEVLIGDSICIECGESNIYYEEI